MIPDHPVIRYMERDGELPRWMRAPVDDELASEQDKESDEEVGIFGVY